MNEQDILKLLTAIHSFCSCMTKADFIKFIGHENAWDNATIDNYWPDFFTLLSYGDSNMYHNLAKWLKDYMDKQ